MFEMDKNKNNICTGNCSNYWFLATIFYNNIYLYPKNNMNHQNKFSNNWSKLSKKKKKTVHTDGFFLSFFLSLCYVAYLFLPFLMNTLLSIFCDKPKFDISTFYRLYLIEVLNFREKNKTFNSRQLRCLRWRIGRTFGRLWIPHRICRTSSRIEMHRIWIHRRAHYTHNDQ